MNSVCDRSKLHASLSVDVVLHARGAVRWRPLRPALPPPTAGPSTDRPEIGAELGSQITTRRRGARGATGAGPQVVVSGSPCAATRSGACPAHQSPRRSSISKAPPMPAALAAAQATGHAAAAMSLAPAAASGASRLPAGLVPSSRQLRGALTPRPSGCRRAARLAAVAGPQAPPRLGAPLQLGSPASQKRREEILDRIDSLIREELESQLVSWALQLLGSAAALRPIRDCARACAAPAACSVDCRASICCRPLCAHASQLPIPPANAAAAVGG